MRMNMETFKSIIFPLAQETGYKVSDLREPEYNSFYSCAFENRTEYFWVLASLENDKWALAKALKDDDSLEFTFLDNAEILKAMKSLFDIDLLRTDQLDAPFDRDPRYLSSDQKVEKPETWGENWFNWWA